MTSLQFKSNEALRNQLADALDNETVRIALAILQSESFPGDCDDAAPELQSVRLLSRQQGRISMLSDLFDLARPPAGNDRERLPDFGTGLTAEELAEAYALK